MATEKTQTPQNPKHTPKQSISQENEENRDTLITPGFRSVAAMAGWDEEALLASLVVEDTPEREAKYSNKRINPRPKVPPGSSKRKRRVQKKNIASIPIVVLDMDSDTEIVKKVCDKSVENEMKKAETLTDEIKENVVEIKKNVLEKEEEGGKALTVKSGSPISSSSSEVPVVPCIDRLREELSCAICLEICFEPSSTSCGHSFCKKCLQSATERCGKRCPKCRQLISNGCRDCTVNTVLWNTIQLLFPKEVEARKAAEPIKAQEIKPSVPKKKTINETRPRNRSTSVTSVVVSRDHVSSRRRRSVANQDGDAALAARLQREEFMEVFAGAPEHPRRPSMSAARENLRAMASRAMSYRVRGRQT